MSGPWEMVAICTGERADCGPAPLRQQTETVSQGRATKHLTELRNSGVLPGSRLRPGALGAHTGQLAGHLNRGEGGPRTRTLETAD